MKTSFPLAVYVEEIIREFISPEDLLWKIYWDHCVAVTHLSLKIDEVNKLKANRELLIAGAMLHDIGIVKTHAPKIGCFGDHPYVAHTYLGRKMLEEKGLETLGLICERHIGVGLTKEEIIKNELPLPHRDMLPLSLEEQIICYADKFFSKSGKFRQHPKPIEKVQQKIARYGKENATRLENLIQKFGFDYIEGTNYALNKTVA